MNNIINHIIKKYPALLFLPLFSVSLASTTENLQEAIKQNKIEEIKKLLKEGASITKLYNFSTIPSLELSKLLLKNKENPISPECFIKILANTPIEKHDPKMCTHEIDNKLIAERDKILRWALEKVTDPNKILKNAVKMYQYGHNSKTTHGKYDLQYKLVNWALAKGANPNNYEIITEAIFNDNFNLKTLELLFNNNYKKINPKIFHEIIKFKKESVGEIFLNPPIALDIKYKHLKTNMDQILKVPRILHHVWLTNEKQKKEILEKDIQNVLRTHNIFLQNNKKWEHIIWVNNKNLIPNSVKKLESTGIKIKEITETKQHFKRLAKKIEELIEKNQWGMASDSLRYELLHYYGGVYADLNYAFARNVEKEIHTYDFFGQSGQSGEMLENFFFGSKPNHPIINETIEIIYDNFYNPKTIINELNGRELTNIMTYAPIVKAYNSIANNNTIDVVYPYIDFDSTSTDHINSNVHQDERIAEKEIRKQKMIIIKKYISRSQDTDFIEKIKYLDTYLSEYDICGTKEHLIGQDLHGAHTWSN